MLREPQHERKIANVIIKRSHFAGGDFNALAKTIVAHYLCWMSTQPTNSDDLASLYRRAFAQYGTQALWNKRAIADPSREDALVVARALRIEGNLAARKLAEQIERACHAAI
jgi:hypothetical protein